MEELLKYQRLLAPAFVLAPVGVPLALRHSQMHRKVLQAREKVGRSSSQDALNATHRKYSKLEDQLTLKAVELRGRDWRTVLAFLKSNWEASDKWERWLNY